MGAGRASAAIAGDFDLPWTENAEVDPGRLAFAVLAEVYAKFGLGENLIPWVEEGRVSENAILSVG